MKRQAGRPSKENGVPVGHNSIVGKSREILASESQDSNTQIQRYVRLTNLVPELLEYVDEGRIKNATGRLNCRILTKIVSVM